MINVFYRTKFIKRTRLFISLVDILLHSISHLKRVKDRNEREREKKIKIGMSKTNVKVVDRRVCSQINA